MNSSQTSRVGRSNSLKRHSRSGEKGQVIVITAFAIVVMFGIVGLAVDVGRMYAARAELGRAVDAAALAGVIEFPDATAASNRATAYLAENEPVAIPDIVPDAANNTLIVDASKTVNMYFIRVLGINTATVSAHAKAGFGVAYLDAVLVLDVTQSMVGDPITNAKAAAINFKNTLLGTSPNGRTQIGVTPFRGCFRPSPITDSSKTACVPSSQQSDLSYNSATLGTLINSLTAGGGDAGTNVCTGLAAGWNIINGAGNNSAEENSRRYMVLLSDGDNYYPGDYTYRAPVGTTGTSSPGGVTIGGTNYPCQPHNTCSSPWNTAPATPCFVGTYGDVIATDTFQSNSWSGGGGTPGWATNWTPSASGANVVDSGSPYQGSWHARIRNTGSVYRKVNLSTYGAATLHFYRKISGMDGSSERARVHVSTNATCSSGWIELENYGNQSSYTETTLDLSAYGGQTNVCLRFSVTGNEDNDIFYFDNVEITTGGASSDGWMNGNDGSNPGTCNENPRPRERQLDVRTLDLARAIKAQNVEIFVVAFTAPTIPGCNLGSTTIWNDEDPTECNTVSGPNSSPAGPIGNNTSDTSGNVRLLKCIASSDDETSDHYFYAANASALPAIFTQIAQQIAHRLIE